MYDWLFEPATLASFLTLTIMEIVLGIDNIVFLSVITSKLKDPVTRKRARQIGLALALVFRIVFLLAITWIIGLTAPVFTVFDQAVSWRDLILIGGGLFLLVKGTLEIHNGIEGVHEGASTVKEASFGLVIAQILMIDLVFSIDSIITAIGMADHVEIMIAAVIISMGVMYVASGPVADFIHRHPTTKMLALAFLLLIGVALIADGIGFHIPRGYIYFSMAFAAAVEIINILARSKRTKGDGSPGTTH
jgi:predicted tellurium resistance membrane protein TerC